MKVSVDQGLCQGHGQCVESAPEVFEVRDDGFAHVLREIDSAQVEGKVREAAGRCPVEAIVIDE